MVDIRGEGVVPIRVLGNLYLGYMHLYIDQQTCVKYLHIGCYVEVNRLITSNLQSNDVLTLANMITFASCDLYSIICTATMTKQCVLHYLSFCCSSSAFDHLHLSLALQTQPRSTAHNRRANHNGVRYSAGSLWRNCPCGIV